MLKVFDNDLFVCGIDEAGRGSVAGPVTAAAVILPKNYVNNEIRDSKKINKPTRLKLFKEIVNISVAYAIIDISNKTIDKINILESTFLAMNKAISKLNKKPDYILIDGNRFKTNNKIRFECIVKGDDKFQSIAAASILAKVHRDNIMSDLHKKYPEYDWINNKGYGTFKHKSIIETYGISEYHRKTFNLKSKQLKINI